jgi:hypothetical protein
MYNVQCTMYNIPIPSLDPNCINIPFCIWINLIFIKILKDNYILKFSNRIINTAFINQVLIDKTAEKYTIHLGLEEFIFYL